MHKQDSYDTNSIYNPMFFTQDVSTEQSSNLQYRLPTLPRLADIYSLTTKQ